MGAADGVGFVSLNNVLLEYFWNKGEKQSYLLFQPLLFPAGVCSGAVPVWAGRSYMSSLEVQGSQSGGS